MTRGVRIRSPNGGYQVISRGNGGETLDRIEEDRRRFLGLVVDLARRFGTEVHACVLMDNSTCWCGAWERS